MRVTSLYRYPVKSMLGESVRELAVDPAGARGDRRWALIDTQTGHIASAKQARLWRTLLQCTAADDGADVRIGLPDGGTLMAGDTDAAARLSEFLGRPVEVLAIRPAGATLERADPEQVLDQGWDAEVDSPLIELAEVAPGDSFVDYAPLHVVTTSTLEHIGVEAARYRPNIVLECPAGTPPYSENDWAGRVLTIGGARLQVLTATPRCVVPTLEHGALPRDQRALRTPAAENRVPSINGDVLPCAGVYLEVHNAGVLRVGDSADLD
ncbi:MAG: hypothetical protein K0R68_2542 [Mycobacterium sp.]|jgi:uncharacterized protein YcbX|nr:hypothetical protein [Mycobacterium sp.]